MNFKQLLITSLFGVIAFSGFSQKRSFFQGRDKFSFNNQAIGKSNSMVDTLGELLNSDSLTIYLAQPGGYVSGINGFGDKEKAQVFPNDSIYGITDVLFLFGHKSSSGDTSSYLTFNFYRTNGIGKTTISSLDYGAPGDLYFDLKVPFDSIDTNGFYNLHLDWPFLIDTEFAIGVSFFGLKAEDTIALYTGYDGQAEESENSWERWFSGSWATLFRSWPLDADLAIFPIIDFQYNGIIENKLPRLTTYPNPSSDYIEVKPFRKGQKGLAHLIDSSGKIALKQPFNPDSDSYRINVDHLPAGSYLLLSSVDGLTQKAKVLISKP